MTNPIDDYAATLKSKQKQLTLQSTLLDQSERFEDLIVRLNVPVTRTLKDGAIVIEIALGDLVSDQAQITHDTKDPAQLPAPTAPKKLVASPPPQRRMSGQPEPASFVQGGLSDDEIATILEMSEQDKKSGEIAKALNRDPRGFYHKVNGVLASTSEDAEVAPQDPPTPERPKPKLVTPPKAPEAQPKLEGLSVMERHELIRVHQIPRKHPFDYQTDIDLIECLAQGQRLAQIAMDFGIDAKALKARFDLLCPQKTIEEMPRVLKVLKHQIAA